MDITKKYKIVVIGDTGVGKTKLINKIKNDDDESQTTPTLGVQFTPKRLEDGTHLNFWDTGGQQNYRSMAKLHYRSADAIVFAYDITNNQSFQNITSWLSGIIQTKTDTKDNIETDKIVKILCANKLDLSNQRTVSQKQGKSYASKHNMLYVQISSKTNSNVSLFTQLLKSQLDKNQNSKNINTSKNELNKTSQKLSINIEKDPVVSQKKTCCC